MTLGVNLHIYKLVAIPSVPIYTELLWGHNKPVGNPDGGGLNKYRPTAREYWYIE